MGMRINKVMCYFNENLEFEEDILQDFFENTTPKQLQDMVIADDFWNKFTQDSDDNRRLSSISSIAHIHRYIVMDTEFLLENAVGFIPFGVGDWSRYDDDIDYQEFYLKNPEHSKNHIITYLNRAIYPYQEYMDKNTGKVIQKFYDFRNSRVHLSDEEKLKPDEHIQKYTGYSSYKEMIDNAVPYVPYDIFMLMYYSKAFKDPFKAYLSLRPAIVEWFS